MDHYEMVETLRAKANVTYEEAKAALEASDWDMLDALVLLESEGKVNGAPEFTTKEKTDEARQTIRNGKGSLSKLGAWIRKMITLGNQNQFVISRKGSELVANAHHCDGPSDGSGLALLPDRAVRRILPGHPVCFPRPGYQHHCQ